MIGRLLIALGLAAACHAAMADQTATLDNTSQTVRFSSGDAEVLAYYVQDDRQFQLTVLITDSDGEPLRVRMPLEPGQSHSIVIDADASGAGQLLTFERTADRLHITTDTDPPRRLAGR